VIKAAILKILTDPERAARAARQEARRL